MLTTNAIIPDSSLRSLVRQSFFHRCRELCVLCIRARILPQDVFCVLRGRKRIGSDIRSSSDCVRIKTLAAWSKRHRLWHEQTSRLSEWRSIDILIKLTYLDFWKMQITLLVLFSTVMIVTIAAAVFCLLFGTYGFFKLKTAQNTEVRVGKHVSITTPIPALVLCFFGLILFLAVAWLVDDKIQIAKLTSTVSKTSLELAELRKDNEQLSAALIRNQDEHAAAQAQAAVKTDLDARQKDLKMAKSEMATLIARNHDEIDQLRRLGERDYFEFTIEAGKAQKVRDVTIEIKSINNKKNEFTLEVKVQDGKSFEKKNRSLNEPIFFYTGGSRQPLELVINKVTKTTATGYLSVPKAHNSGSVSPG
jgi:hypothetical protein